MIRKADIILAIFLAAAGLAVSYAFSMGEETGQMAVIYADGKQYASYSLSEDRVAAIDQNGHTNKITIKGGQVSMTFSDCANQNCVQQGKISNPSQSIICLPNKVVVEIQGGDEEFDAVAK